MTSLTLEQKAALVVGAGFWVTASVGDIPAITMTDGPHGVRKPTGDASQLGIGDSNPATCFPPAAGIASSWNPDLPRPYDDVFRRALAKDPAGV